MSRILFRLIILSYLFLTSVVLLAQGIRSDYLDLSVPGQWESASNFSNAVVGAELYYDTKTGSLVQIRALPNMEKVPEISKYFQQTARTPSSDPSQVLSAVAFPLPDSYAARAAKDVANGVKPPRMWEMKEGDGNPTWFYTAQLFGQYNVKSVHGGSEVEEQYLPVSVVRAEHKSVAGGEALVLEVETDKPANEQALKRFHMPAGMKDQRLRFVWVQYSPGGIASGQGVLSVVAASAANSGLTSDELLGEITSAKLKPME